jgi:flagellar motor switch protein FliN/FliY
MSDQENVQEDFIGDIPVELVVEMGRKRMLLRDIAKLKTDDIVDLEQTIEAPLNIVVGGKLLARGELVKVNGRIGLRIIEMVGKRSQEA